jgi:hypothetical protein
MNQTNYRECSTCKGHLFSVYIGGAKVKLENQYYCKKCKTIAQIEFMVYSKNKPTTIFLEEDCGTDLKSQNEIIEQIEIEQERIFN